MRADPVGRGTQQLCAARGDHGVELLQAAASGLAAGQAVAIATGFYIAEAATPAAETDGPPGALLLADVLRQLGIEVALVTDEFGAPLVEAGRDALGLSDVAVHVVPLEEESSQAGASPRADRWAREFLASDFGTRLTHLVAIERAGPSHTSHSVRRLASDPQVWSDFEREVPDAERDRCHNMAGRSIDRHTAKTHRLFELASEQDRQIGAIAVADGGNEIGFGAACWSQLLGAIASPHGAISACRVPADQLLIAGISDWGAYALALATCCAAERSSLIDTLLSDSWLVDRQRSLVEHMVRETSAVDGITCQRAATIDSLGLEEYLVWLTSAVDTVRTASRT